MDKAYLSLKSKGVVLDNRLYSTNTTARDSGSCSGINEARNRGKILEEARLYKEISNTFQLLHNNQL